MRLRASTRRAPTSASLKRISTRTSVSGPMFPLASYRGRENLPSPGEPAASAHLARSSSNLFSFEIDIWGRLRRATEASRADLLRADWTRKAVVTTLISDVATAYFSLLELDAELEIAKNTLATRSESLRLIKLQLQGGVSTLLDVRQGEQLVYSAAQTIPDAERQIEQTENQISYLLGRNPESISRSHLLTEQQTPPEVPAGLPSKLLERRPDIQAAEQNLIAANAIIGVAKAAYFPADYADRGVRLSKHGAGEFVLGLTKNMEFHPSDYPADLRRRTDHLRCRAG